MKLHELLSQLRPGESITMTRTDDKLRIDVTAAHLASPDVPHSVDHRCTISRYFVPLEVERAPDVVDNAVSVLLEAVR